MRCIGDQQKIDQIIHKITHVTPSFKFIQVVTTNFLCINAKSIVANNVIWNLENLAKLASKQYMNFFLLKNVLLNYII